MRNDALAARPEERGKIKRGIYAERASKLNEEWLCLREENGIKQMKEAAFVKLIRFIRAVRP